MTMVSTHGRKQGKNCKNLKANLIRLEKKKRCATYLKELLMKKELKKREKSGLEKINISFENVYEPEPDQYFPSSVWQDYLNCFYEESDCSVDVKFEKNESPENFNPTLDLINVDNSLAKKLYNQYKLLELDDDLRNIKDEELDFSDDLEESCVKEEISDETSKINKDVQNSAETVEHINVAKVKKDQNDPIIKADTEFNFKHSKRKKFEYRPYLDPFMIKIILDEPNEAKESIRPNLRNCSLNNVDENIVESALDLVPQNHKKYRRKKNRGRRHFQCLMCGAKFKTKGNLRAHCEITHSEERNYQCSDCGMKFKTKYHLKTHCIKIHSKNQTGSLKSDSENQATEPRYPKRRSCQISSFVPDQIFPSKPDLTCNLCHVVLNNKRLLNMHMLVAHTTKPRKKMNSNKMHKLKMKRSVLRKTYSQQKTLPADVSITCSTFIPASTPVEGIKIFECDDCSACYSSKCLLKNHILETHLFYHCLYPNCGLVFKKKVYLQRHNLRLHPKRKTPGRPRISSISNKAVQKKKYPCQPLKSTLPPTKKEESPSLTNKISYECDHCKVAFSSKHLLIKHMLHTHLKSDSANGEMRTKRKVGRPLKVSINKERRFKCDQCDFSFKTRSHLQSHRLQRHSEERNFICYLCNAQFKTKGILKTHSLRLHKTYHSNKY